ncbi:MAG: hypothetical protein GTN73_05595 [Candidatus Aminicenantes bacterium]|nr:hypothetical protein [Candidatus Aminicenantes bacterium]
MRSRMAIFLIGMAILLSFPQGSGAHWVPAGNPGGGRITSFAVKGSNLFVSTDLGVYLSPDNGATWTAVNSGLPGKNGDPGQAFVGCLAVSEANLVAGTPDGIFISANNGKNWTATSSAEHMHTAYCFAASGTNIFGGAWCGVLLSTNNGKTWTFMDTDIPLGPYLTVASKEDYVRSLAVSGENFVAGTGYEKFVFVSRWNGKSWETVSSDSPENLDVDCVVLNGKYFFAGTSRGVFLSKNKGKSWIERN